MIDRITSEELLAAREQTQINSGWVDPGPLRLWLKNCLAQMNPDQVTVDQVLTCLIGELMGMGVDLAPAHKIATASKTEKEPEHG